MHFHLIKRIVSFIKRLLVAFLICDVTLTTLQAIPIRHLHISHNAPSLPPKILHNLCFSFLLGLTAVLREIENNAYAKFWRAINKVHSERCASSVLNEEFIE